MSRQDKTILSSMSCKVRRLYIGAECMAQVSDSEYETEEVLAKTHP